MGALELDIATVMDLLIVGNVAAVAMFAVYGMHGPAEPSKVRFVAGKALQTVAWILLRLRGTAPDILSVYAGNALLLAGFNLESLALVTATSWSRRKNRGFAILAASGIALFFAFAGTPNGRVAAASAATILPYGALAAFMLRDRPASATKRFLGIGALIFCAILIARAATALSSGPRFGLMSPSLIQSLAFLPLYLSLVVTSTGFVLLLREKGDALLRESEDKYRSLVERASEGIVLAQDGRFVFANRRMGEMLGVKADELPGQDITRFIWPEDRQMVLDLSRERMGGRDAPESYDFRIFDAKGQARWVSLTATAVRWDGRPATLSLLTDIDGRKRSETRILELLREKETLLREVHHRVRNNLTLAMSLLSLQSDGASGRDAAEMLLDARNRLRTMIRIYERLDERNGYGRVPVKDYVPALMEDIAATYPAGARVRFTYDLEDVEMDNARLTTLGIIMNEACTNSLKYAFDGVEAPAIGISVAATADGGARVSIRDNGKGLPPDRRTGGSRGLGLAIIEALAGQLGAALEVDGSGGTAYRLEFPLGPGGVTRDGSAT